MTKCNTLNWNNIIGGGGGGGDVSKAKHSIQVKGLNVKKNKKMELAEGEGKALGTALKFPYQTQRME